VERLGEGGGVEGRIDPLDRLVHRRQQARRRRSQAAQLEEDGDLRLRQTEPVVRFGRGEDEVFEQGATRARRGT
jgi:hypothetical protein